MAQRSITSFIETVRGSTINYVINFWVPYLAFLLAREVLMGFIYATPPKTRKGRREALVLVLGTNVPAVVQDKLALIIPLFYYPAPQINSPLSSFLPLDSSINKRHKNQVNKYEKHSTFVNKKHSGN